MTSGVRIHVGLEADVREVVLGSSQWERLEELGRIECSDSGDVDWAVIAREADIAITGWGTTPIDLAAVSGKQLRLIAHTGGSIRRLLPKMALSAGLRVTQASAAMVDAVAEYALALCLAMLRRVPLAPARLAADCWSPATPASFGTSIADSKMGVIGLSRVGVRFTEIAGQLGATDSLAYDPYADRVFAARLNVQLVGLDEVLKRSNVVAIHAPLTEETEGMLGEAELALLADDALLVNTARARIIDESALIAELSSGRIRAALDVFHHEPLPADYPLVGLQNVLISPHQAGATLQARSRQGDLVVNEIERFVSGQRLLHEVRAEDYDRLA